MHSITLPLLLICASASIVLLLGLVHLLYTFRGDRLHPRDPVLTARMREVSLVLTRQTTLWRAWIGFNASHSLGAILFGLIYDFLALTQPALLLQSIFLQLLGLLTLGSYVWLARRYWFVIPFRALVLALLLYAGALLCAWVR